MEGNQAVSSSSSSMRRGDSAIDSDLATMTQAPMNPQESLLSKIKFLVVAGVGLFADGYLNISIGLVVPMLGYIYFKDTDSAISTTHSDVIKGSLSLGMIVGQITFGILGDALGRHKIYGRELMATMFGTLMCILLPWKGLSHSGIVAWMSVWRMVTGFGIGGDYPMSSTLAAEKSPLGSRAIHILSVFCCIGLGSFTSSIVYIILLTGFKNSIQDNIDRVEYVWRLLMGLGLVPCALTLYWRLVMKSTKPFEKYGMKMSQGNEEAQNRSLKEHFADFRVYFSNRRHAMALFSVCAVWFLFDIAFYGINLNQSVILSQIGFSKAPTQFGTLWNTAVGNIIVQSAGYLPGFFIGIFLPDWIGRKTQQLVFCAAVAGLYAIWAGITNHTSTGGLMTVFTISQLVLNAGPNITTFILPVELFPTRVRATAHGVAAASGKAGAVLTAFAFGSATDAIGINGVLGLLSGIIALCSVLTLLIPEPKGRTIDDIEGDVMYGDAPAHGASISSAEHVHESMDGKGDSA